MDRALRHRVCQLWLTHLPAADRSALPGDRIEGGYGLIGWVLFVLFFLLGIGTARGALQGSDEARHGRISFFLPRQG